MGNENDQLHQLTEAVYNFVEGGTLVRPNNYNLEGPLGNVPTVFNNFASLFPSMPGCEGIFAVTGLTSVESGITVLNKVIKLKIPQRIKSLGIPNNQRMRSTAETIAQLQGYPTIVVALGATQDTKEKVAFLFCLPGLSPENALEEIKNRARRKLASLS